MTQDIRDVLNLALDALENAVRYHGIMLVSDPPQNAWKYHKVEDKADKAITAIKEALAQTQEPVAIVTSETGNPDITMSWWHEPALPVGTKLYTTTPQRSESSGKPSAWVGLTDEELTDLFYNTNLGQQSAVLQAIALLKQKNGYAEEKNT